MESELSAPLAADLAMSIADTLAAFRATPKRSIFTLLPPSESDRMNSMRFKRDFLVFS